jgi:hypothetical protein
MQIAFDRSLASRPTRVTSGITRRRPPGRASIPCDVLVVAYAGSADAQAENRDERALGRRQQEENSGDFPSEITVVFLDFR